LKTALEVAEKNGNAPWLGIFKATLAGVKFQCGDIPGAGHLAGELTHEYSLEPDGQVYTMATITSGFVDLESGSVDSALQRFSAAARSPAGSRFFLDWYWRMMAQLGVSRTWLMKGDATQAKHAAAIFFESATSSAGPDLNALGWELNARLALHDREYDRACGFAEQALGAFASYDIPMIAWRVEMTASDCYLRAGDSVRAGQHRAVAMAIVSTLIGSFHPNEPLRESLAASADVRRALE
jgi:hypothetical protein